MTIDINDGFNSEVEVYQKLSRWSEFIEEKVEEITSKLLSIEEHLMAL